MTTLSTNDSDREIKELSRYKQFVRWTFGAAFIFGGLLLLAFRSFEAPSIAFAGMVVLGYSICLIIVMGLLRKNQIHTAVTISSIGLLVAALLLAFSLPIAIPAISILPLMAIAHALPYLKAYEIRLLTFISWLIAISVISINIFIPELTGLPAWFSNSFRITSFGAAFGIVLLLLWQFASRLTTMLEQTRVINADLEIQSTHLQTANEELKQFASIVSHDLRAPLLNIRGFSKELRFALKTVEEHLGRENATLNTDQLGALSDALHKDIPEALEFIDSSVIRMDGYLTALLKLSRLGRRELQFESVDVNALVNETLKTLGHTIGTKQVDIKVGNLPKIYADRISLEQIFGNILTNAVNYLEPSRAGQIVITAESEANKTIFSIQDNGRGIAYNDYAKVFTPLRRAGRQDVPGEGMGLAYVQTLVRLHAGEIWFESEPNVGTTFFFSISSSLTGGTNDE